MKNSGEQSTAYSNNLSDEMVNEYVTWCCLIYTLSVVNKYVTWCCFIYTQSMVDKYVTWCCFIYTQLMVNKYVTWCCFIYTQPMVNECVTWCHSIWQKKEGDMLDETHTKHTPSAWTSIAFLATHTQQCYTIFQNNHQNPCELHAPKSHSQPHCRCTTAVILFP